MYATIPPSSTNEQGASTCTRGRRRVSSSDTRLSSPAQDTTIQPLPAGSVNRIGRAWCNARPDVAGGMQNVSGAVRWRQRACNNFNLLSGF